MKTFRRNPLVAMVAMAVGSWAAAGALPALAQSQGGAARAADSGELQSVSVSANRRLEDQQKVNVSVTGLNNQALAERNLSDVSQLDTVVPGFTFGRSGADARPAMRGVRTENVAVNADTTIGYFVDGIYKSRAQQAMMGFVDVSRVEVMRGPQGTLFGRNTFGGTVAITTNAPELKSNETTASLLVGNYGKVRGEGIFNLPLSETTALRLVAVKDKSDPWVKNDFNTAAGMFDQDMRYFRGSLLFKPTKDLEAVFRVDSTTQGGNGGSAFGYKMAGTYVHTPSCQQLFNATLTIINPRGGNRDAVNDCTRTQGAGTGAGANAIGTGVDLGIPIYKAGNAYVVDNDYRTFLDLSDRNMSLDLTYQVPGATLKSITGYADFVATRTSDSDFSASTIALDYQATAAKTFSQEFQILSNTSGPLGYVAGVYLFRDELRGTFINQQLPRTIRSSALGAPLSLAQNGAGFYDNQMPETDSRAVYGQLNYKLSSALTLTAGARYTKDTKSFKYANANAVLPLNAAGAPDGNLINLSTVLPPTSAYGTAGTSNCLDGATRPGFNCLPGTNTATGATYNDATFSKGTGRLALDYELNKDQLVYLTVSNGFRSGGFNSAQALESARTFKPEEVVALEVGSKNRFLKNTLQLNVSAFSNDYTNLQEQRQIPVGNTTISAIFNAAKASAKGLEAELEWRASRATTFGGTLSLLDAKYTSFPDVALPFGTSILVADPTSTAPQTDANGVVIAPAGQRRLFAPGYKCGVVPGTGGVGQPAAAYGCDLSGNRIPYAARSQGSVFLKHDIGLAGGGRLTPMVVVSYNSGFFGQPTNAQIEKQGAFTKTDVKVNWRMNDQWSLLGFVDNVGNTQTINRFVWGGGGALQVSAAPPRMMGLKLTYSKF
ncbi:MAG: TonB-dependent receptor [Betaproteobacteria bacterium]|nr:TonB-dependent receptor [Betaproteobacteria bacterium]NBT10949.1 TonB-dependent receptor [Betaproteobacteria bacterium]NBU50038.1 TonB-dependent receptor [Betaproteobacteria bacterium]